MKPFSIAGVQMYVPPGTSNVEAMKHKVELVVAIYPWVEMIVFSELCSYGPLTTFARESLIEHEAVFSGLAKKHGIWLLPGTVYQKKNTEIYNTTYVVSPDGITVCSYHKLFPFIPYEEGVTGGTEFTTFDIPEVGKFGLSICYDLWFPETARTLASMGVDVILHPTLTGTIDRDVELSIVQATAAINQCFVFDVNGLGAGGNGRSIVCGPDGRILHQANVGDEIFPIELDLERVKRSRELGLLRLGQPLKSFRDRKVSFDIYTNGLTSEYLKSLGPIEKHKKTRRIQNIPSDQSGYRT
jgi:predicted amidohydrolase